MHMLLILLALCLRKPNGISHLFSIIYAFVGNGWSIFQQIFADHWKAFQHTHPRYQTPYYDGLVAKMLACGQPDKMG